MHVREISLQEWYYAVAIAGVIVGVVRWFCTKLYKWGVAIYDWGVRLDTGLSNWEKVKSNHLPHIEFYLRELCIKEGIKYIPMEALDEAREDGNEGGDRGNPEGF